MANKKIVSRKAQPQELQSQRTVPASSVLQREGSRSSASRLPRPIRPDSGPR